MTFPLIVPPWVDDTSTITAAQINQINVNLSRALDGTGGGDYTPAVVLGIGGAGLRIIPTAGVARNVQLVTRTVRRQMPLAGSAQVAGWIPAVSGAWENAISSAPLVLYLDDMPHGNVLQQVTVRFRGAVGGAPLPVVMPTLGIYRVGDTNIATLLGLVVSDPSPDPATYRAWHDITVAGIAHTLDLYNYRYIAEVQAEGAVGYVAGAMVCQCYTEVDCSQYTEY